MSLTRTFDIIPYQVSHNSGKQVLNFRVESGWRSYSSEELLSHMQAYAGFLQAQGLKKGDYIFLFPKAGIPPAILLDLAAQYLGVVVVLIHSTTKQEQFAHILSQVQPTCVFFQDEELAERFDRPTQSFPRFQIGGDTYLAFEQQVLATPHLPLGQLEQIGNSIQEEDLSTIIFTSGTKGLPKGVMLTHRNIMSNVTALAPMLPGTPKDRAISFLPYSHVFERTALYTYLCLGVQLYIIEEPNRLSHYLPEIRPHLFTAVPRIVERMYDQALLTQGDRNFLGKYLMKWAFRQGVGYKDRKGVDPIKWSKMWLSRMLVFRRFRKAIGGKVKVIIVGAAHMNPSISRTFALAGIPIREGYGMTEASPVISVNRMKPGLNEYGTVGLPLPNVQVKIHDADEEGIGEIWARGPSIMKGYLDDPKATELALTSEGWLRTGDMGRFVKKRFLQITDRKKDLFKTSSGKYIAPQVLEAYFRESHFIDHLLLIGFKRPFLSALLLPNFDALEHWALHADVHWTSPPYMVLNIKVKERMQQEIDQLNSHLPGHERIHAFHLLNEPWTIEGGELSHTLKPVRDAIIKKYQKDIDRMYE